jgi:predicted thioesterase
MDAAPECVPGRKETRWLTVGEDDTATAVGSGDVPVLASPRLVALAEQAAVAALGDCLPEGKTSVGTFCELHHNTPSRIGETVGAEAVLIGVHGRQLELAVTVTSGEQEVATLRHRRMLMDRSRFSGAT